MFLTRNPLCLQTEDNVRKGTTNSTTSRKWDAKYHNTVKPVLSDHPKGNGLHLHLSRSQWPLGRHGHSNPLPPFDFVFSFSYGVENLNPVHSEILFSQCFFCRPLFLPPCTVPCKIVLASPDDLDTCPNHFNLRFFTVVKGAMSAGEHALWGYANYFQLSKFYCF